MHGYLVVDVKSFTTMLLEKLLRAGLGEHPGNGDMQAGSCKGTFCIDSLYRELVWLFRNILVLPSHNLIKSYMKIEKFGNFAKETLHGGNLQKCGHCPYSSDPPHLYFFQINFSANFFSPVF